MNAENIMALMPALMVVFLILGVYKTVFEKKVQAQENIQNLLNAPTAGGAYGVMGGKNTEQLLKRRKRVNKDGDKVDTWEKMELQLEQANLLLRPNEFIMICVGTAIAGGILLFLMMGQNLLIALPGGIGCFFAPFVYMKIKTALRMGKANAQFADVLDAMTNGFKTGYGFSRAVQMIADNFSDPWGTEFGKMAAELNLGLTQEEALFNLARRVPSADVDLFVTGMIIQKETGGNMTELLGILSKTCRDRFKLIQKVGAISAQGKLSAGIICCVPFLLASLMFMFLPEPTFKFYTNPIGIVIMLAVGTWMLIGIGVLWKIVQIDV
ncbi:MAG: type II secretion system F family protein [Candidatus Melainabacteria bacterium]